MKTAFISILLAMLQLGAFACPMCEKKQPKFLQGITHGTGPESNWDWVIIGTVAGITLLTLILSVKYLVYPNERNIAHIKNSILSSQTKLF